MIIELWMLVGGGVLGLIHLTVASFTFKIQVGNRYTVGPRDEQILPTGLAGRMYRAQMNFLETFPIFIAFVLTVILTGTSDQFSQWGSAVYLTGRTAFLPLYALGVPWFRTFSWNIASIGLVMTGVAIIL